MNLLSKVPFIASLWLDKPRPAPAALDFNTTPLAAPVTPPRLDGSPEHLTSLYFAPNPAFHREVLKGAADLARGKAVVPTTTKRRAA